MIAVWFSCGAASAVAAKLALEQFDNVQLVNNPVAEEDEDNRRFLRDVEQWLGVKIDTAINHKYPDCSAVTVWEARQFMSGPKGAPCTIELKKQARRMYEMDHDIEAHVLGFTSEETDRLERFREREPDMMVIATLVDAGLSKADCYQVLLNAGLEIPRVYRQGYPNANCIGCVKATSPTYWNHVRKMHPEVFAARAEQSRRLGSRLVRVNNERIFLDELDPRAKGMPMKNMDFECGLFCGDAARLTTHSQEPDND